MLGISVYLILILGDLKSLRAVEKRVVVITLGITFGTRGTAIL